MQTESRDIAVISAALAAVLVSVLSTGVFLAFGREPEPAPQQEAQAAKTTPEPTQDPEPEPQPEESEPEEPSERDVYVETWAARIDAFNAGYPLEGYGATFAEAAYDNGVDPRFSPAIARVESGSGQICAYSCNAWGWGSSSWPDWDTAIREQVSSLAQNYGYTLTWDGAAKYDSEETDEWYAQVEGCMGQIWESDSL